MQRYQHQRVDSTAVSETDSPRPVPVEKGAVSASVSDVLFFVIFLGGGGRRGGWNR